MAGKLKTGFACVALLAATGCADMSDKQRSTAIGAGAGALGGAAIGSFAGSAGWGALIGAGVGAAGGLAVGQSRENERRAYQRWRGNGAQPAVTGVGPPMICGGP